MISKLNLWIKIIKILTKAYYYFVNNFDNLFFFNHCFTVAENLFNSALSSRLIYDKWISSFNYQRHYRNNCLLLCVWCASLSCRSPTYCEFARRETRRAWNVHTHVWDAVVDAHACEMQLRVQDVIARIQQCVNVYVWTCCVFPWRIQLLLPFREYLCVCKELH